MNKSEIIEKVLVPFNFAAGTEFTVETVAPVLAEPLSNYFDSLEFFSFIIDVENEFEIEGIQEYQESLLAVKKFTLGDVVEYLEKRVNA